MDTTDRQGPSTSSLGSSSRTLRFVQPPPLGTVDPDIEREEAIPTVEIFWSLNETAVALKEMTADLTDPALTCVLLGLRYILPDLRPEHVQFAKIDNVDVKPRATRDKLLQAAFMVACHLIKPVTGENASYLEKRWTAAAANLSSTQINLTGYDKSDLTSTMLKEVEQKIRNYVTPKLIAEQLYGSGRDGWPVISLALREQLKLVYSRAGMVAIETMFAYCKRPKNAAIGISEVWTQALEFLKRYKESKEEVEAQYRGGWPFARSLAESSILPLACGNYPDLYYVAIKTAKRHGVLSTRQFQTSDKTLSADKEELDKRIRLRITQVSEEGSEALREAMRELGVNMEELKEKEASLGRKRRRGDNEDSPSSSEDEDGLQSRRRR